MLAGKVTDPSGAILPAVEITATNESTGERRTVMSDANGNYEIPLLSPGSYTLKATKAAFAAAARPGIRVLVTETTRLDVQLQLGLITQQVFVQSVPFMVETTSQALGRAADELTVEDLPLVTRNYTQILGLSPGILSSVNNAGELGSGSVALAPNSVQSSQGTFAHGARAYDNGFEMDGLSVNDVQSSGSNSGGLPIPNPDTIEEFKVQTGLYGAVYGRYAGASVNVITKSGTNTLHGSVFEFFRNTALNANDYFLNETGQKRAVLDQNQFGFALGGPIKKDRLLFFGSYQGTRQVNGLPGAGANVTCESSFHEPAITDDRSQAALGALFAGQTGALGGVAIAPDGSNINPIALTLLQYKLPDGSFLIPTPKTVDPTAPFGSQGLSVISEPCHYSENQYMGNLTYLQSGHNTISFRLFAAATSELVTFPSSNIGTGIGNIRGYNANQDTNFWVTSLDDTYMFNPRTVNDARLGFTRTYPKRSSQAPFTWSSVGVAEGTFAENNSLPAVDILGSLNMAPSAASQFRQSNFQFQDVLSYIRGAHSFQFGGNLSRYYNDNDFIGFGSGLIFLSWPDFLLGLDAADNGTPFSNVYGYIDAYGLYGREYQMWNGALYAQDDYRVNSRVNLNLGLRYERFGLLGDNLGRNGSFNFALANPNPPPSGSVDGYVVASNFSGSTPPGVTRSSNTAATNGNGRNNFGPRLGLTLQLVPNRLVLRTGYGIYFSQPTVQSFFQGVVSPPYALTRYVVATGEASASFADAFGQSFPTASTFPVFPAYSPGTSLSLLGPAPDYRGAAMYQEYAMNLQTQLTHDLLLEVGYDGSRGTHLIQVLSPNQALSASPQNPIRGQTSNTLANIPLRVPVEGLTTDSVYEIGSGGRSWYNALQASVTKRFSHGLQFLASYTFSKNLTTDAGDVSGMAAGVEIARGSQYDPHDRYGRASYIDRPNRFTFSVVYDFPQRKSLTGFTGGLLNGWEASGVGVVQSGTALSIWNTNADNAFGISEDFAQIANGCTAGQLVTSGPVQHKLNNYFNKSCLTTPPVIGADGIATAFGNSAPGIVNGPDQNNWDLALIKTTSIAERYKVQFRAEFFNAFNHPQFANPDITYSDSTFGLISNTAVNPRIVQLALKVMF